MKLISCLLLIFVIVACDENNEEAIIEEMVYNQSGCYGTCPVYEITINSGGTLRYIGFHYVAVIDTLYEQVTKEQLRLLTAAFNESNYFLFEDEYTEMSVTDMQSVYTSIKMGGKYKSVRHYFGDRSAPEALKTLYSKINAILNTQRWIGS